MYFFILNMILTNASTKTMKITTIKPSYSFLLLDDIPDIPSPDVCQVVGQGGHHHGQLHEDGEEGYIEGVLNRGQVSMMLSFLSYHLVR
jgi:hypothetical protein